MARNRMIKPQFWVSKTLMRVSRDARLMFIGLWNFADDYGILENSNRRILGEVFPYDENVSEKDIKKWKDELLHEKLLMQVLYDGHSYLYIRSWEEHQKVAHRAKETIPHETLMRVSRDPHPQIEREVEREVEREGVIASPKLTVEDFEKVWKIYPNKKNKQKAQEKFLKLKPEILELILKAIPEHVKQEAWVKDGGRFIPHLITWLNGNRWEDEINTPQSPPSAVWVGKHQKKLPDGKVIYSYNPEHNAEGFEFGK